MSESSSLIDPIDQLKEIAVILVKMPINMGMELVPGQLGQIDATHRARLRFSRLLLLFARGDM